MSRQFLTILTVITITLGLSGCSLFKSKNQEVTQTTKKIEQPVNQISVADRPYVELLPLSPRNKLSLVIHERKIDADSVEATLEYDRNEGVLDAVLKNFPLAQAVQTEEIFLGSKSAGGHTTFHDDVIGGTIKLAFDGDKPYTLETPWRYDDKEAEYAQISTADGKFQVAFDKPFKTPKVVVMQSPGYPGELKGELIAGPYLFRGVGELPESTAKLTLRLAEADSGAKLQGWDGKAWQELDATVTDKTLTATAPILDVYVVTK